MKKKEKKTIDVYDSIIYPRKLIVTKNVTLQDLRKRFMSRNGVEFSEDFDPIDHTYTYYALDKNKRICRVS